MVPVLSLVFRYIDLIRLEFVSQISRVSYQLFTCQQLAMMFVLSNESRGRSAARSIHSIMSKQQREWHINSCYSLDKAGSVLADEAQGPFTLMEVEH